MYFRVRWPDGVIDRCYSPSTVVEEVFSSGAAYPVGEFVDRSRRVLTIADARVRVTYGYGCGNAARQLAEIERTAASFADLPGGRVIVEGFERRTPPGGRARR
jgi:uncharacterized repeat protein (TIGR04042 family)